MSTPWESILIIKEECGLTFWSVNNLLNEIPKSLLVLNQVWFFMIVSWATLIAVKVSGTSCILKVIVCMPRLFKP